MFNRNNTILVMLFSNEQSTSSNILLFNMHCFSFDAELGVCYSAYKETLPAHGILSPVCGNVLGLGFCSFLNIFL